MTTDHEAEQALATALRSRAQSSGTPQLSLEHATADSTPPEAGHRAAWFAVAACLVVAVTGAALLLRASTGDDSTTAATTPVDTTSLRPMPSQTPALDQATIRSLIAVAQAYYGVKVGDPCPPWVELSPQVMFQPAVLNPEGEPCTVAAWFPNYTADGYSITDLPLGDYDEDGTFHPPGSSTAPATPLIVGLPECREAGTAYEMTDPVRVGQPGAPTYLYFGEDLAGGVATLAYAKDSVTRADLQAPNIQRQTASFDDASFTVSWISNNEPVALLSGKRMEAADLTALADAVEIGEMASTGFNEVSLPDQGAHVLGHSCTTGVGFLAVEVLEGSPSAQAMYMLNTDPTHVQAQGNTLILTYNRSNPAAPVPTSPVSFEEFDSLVASAQARGGP